MSRLTPQNRYLDESVASGLRSILIGRGSLAQSQYQGRHLARRQGQSLEYRDHREYVPGDDPRFIDWRVFARSDRYYVRQFEADTSINTLLIIDESASMMSILPNNQSKLDYARRLMVTLTYLLLGQTDRVAVCRFTEGIELLLPPRSDMGAMIQLLQNLEKPAGSKQTNPKAILDALSVYRRQRTLVVVFSDLIAKENKFISLFSQLKGSNIECCVWNIVDPLEEDLPLRGNWTFIDPETGREIQLNASSIRKRYAEKFREYRNTHREKLISNGFGYFSTRTDTPYTAALAQFLLAQYGGRNT